MENAVQFLVKILLLLFPQEPKLESAQFFSRQISHHFSRDVLQLQMPNFMMFFTLQTFVPECLTERHPHLEQLVDIPTGGHREVI